MPFARRRLDLLLVPHDPERVLDEGVLARLASAGLCEEDGTYRPTDGLPSFERIRIDRPAGPVLYANQAGGVAVRCPRDGQPVARAVGRAVEAWRAGGSPELACVCGETHPLTSLTYAPPAAPGRSALVVVDVDAYRLEDPARGLLVQAMGPFRLVPRRVS